MRRTPRSIQGSKPERKSARVRFRQIGTGEVEGTTCNGGRSPWDGATMTDLCTEGYSDVGNTAPAFRDCRQEAIDLGNCGDTLCADCADPWHTPRLGMYWANVGYEKCPGWVVDAINAEGANGGQCAAWVRDGGFRDEDVPPRVPTPAPTQFPTSLPTSEPSRMPSVPPTLTGAVVVDNIVCGETRSESTTGAVHWPHRHVLRRLVADNCERGQEIGEGGGIRRVDAPGGGVEGRAVSARGNRRHGQSRRGRTAGAQGTEEGRREKEEVAPPESSCRVHRVLRRQGCRRRRPFRGTPRAASRLNLPFISFRLLFL